jgi:hypothetical protein
MTGVKPDAAGNSWLHYAAWLATADDLQETLSSPSLTAATDLSTATLSLNAFCQNPCHLACLRGDPAMIKTVLGVSGRCEYLISHFPTSHSSTFFCSAATRAFFAPDLDGMAPVHYLLQSRSSRISPPSLPAASTTTHAALVCTTLKALQSLDMVDRYGRSIVHFCCAHALAQSLGRVSTIFSAIQMQHLTPAAADDVLTIDSSLALLTDAAGRCGIHCVVLLLLLPQLLVALQSPPQIPAATPPR